MSATRKKAIRAKALELRDAGRLFDPADAEMQDLFAGSIDRFCDIGLRLRELPRVLDAGAGHGVLTALLSELGHRCVAVDVMDPQTRFERIYRLHDMRHNREFTREELRLLLERAGFRHVEVSFLRSRRCRAGIARLKSIGSALRDAWPAARKSLIAFAEK